MPVFIPSSTSDRDKHKFCHAPKHNSRVWMDKPAKANAASCGGVC